MQSTLAGISAQGKGKTLWILGDWITIKIRGEQTGGAYALFELLVNVGGGAPPHLHNREDEGFYVIEGELTLGLGDRTVMATPGTYVHAPRGIPHSYKNSGKATTKALLLVVPAGIEKFFEEVGVEVSAPGVSPHALSDEDVARVVETTPKYGIRMLT